MSRITQIQCLIVLLIIISTVFVSGRGGRGGGGRGYRGGSRYRSFSSSRRPTTYYSATASGYLVYGIRQYRTRFSETTNYHPNPAVCYSDNIIVRVPSNHSINSNYSDISNDTAAVSVTREETTRSGYFVCPSEDNSNDETHCCGRENKQRCCAQEMYSEISEKLTTTQQPMTKDSSVCQLDIVGGSCGYFTPVYGFDIYSLTCTRFLYSGCNGNDNRFNTLEDCRATCEGKIDVCELPITTGPCSSSFTRWAYDPHISSCREFRYSGCLGNFNRFESKEECETRCG